MIHRSEIDGLRAVAVVPVILFHAGLVLFPGGYVGVDVFFVISGYLITSIIRAEQQTGTFRLSRFYERRARRILPALVLVVLCTIPAACVLLAPRALQDFGESVAAVTVFASNLLFRQESGYFGGPAELKPLLHTWSLAVEEQFYLLFPLLLILLSRLPVRALAGALALLFAASLVTAELTVRDDRDMAFFLLHTRAFELLAGALCALWLNGSPPLGASRLKQAGGAIGLALIFASCLMFDETTLSPGLMTVVPVGGAVLVILCATPDTVAGRLLALRPVVGLGLISYSAYLWHQPLLALGRVVLGELSLVVTLVMIGATLLLAALSWRFVETPFRQKGRIPVRQVVVLAVSFSLALFLFGLAAHLTKGFASLKLNAAQLSLLDTAHESPKRDACHADERDPIPPEASCTYFEGPAEVAVLGDSHGVELAYALALGLKPQGTAVRHLTHSACYPAYGRDVPGPNAACDIWTEAAIALLLADPQVKTVVVTYRLTTAFATNDAVEAERRRTSLLATVSALQAAGKQVIYVVQAPELPRTVEDLIAVLPEGGPISGLSQVEWDARLDAVGAGDLLTALPADVQVINPADRYCPDGTCLAATRSEALYFDDDHMSVAGAQVVAQSILAALDD